MVHLWEAAGLALSFNLNHRWTMAAFSTSIEETGLHEGPINAWKPKEYKNSPRNVELLATAKYPRWILQPSSTEKVEWS